MSSPGNPIRLFVTHYWEENDEYTRVFEYLEAPPRRVTGWDTPFPYTLENEYLPLAHRILPALVETARF